MNVKNTIREPLKFTLFIVIATLVLLSSIPFFSNNQVNAATKDDEWNSPINKCKNIDKESDDSSDDEKDKSDKDSKPAGVELGSDGAWLKKGTKQYEAAKKVYDTFTDELGTSGTFAVGVLGNINRESHFQVDIKELEGGQNYAGRGYGLYQFTPAEKFLNSKEAKDGKGVDQQTKFVWDTEFKTGAVTPFLPKYSDFKTIKELVTTDDIEKATRGFYAYERGRDFEGDMAKSIPYSKQADKVFNKDKKEADEDKLKKSLNSGSSGKTADVDGSKKKATDNNQETTIDGKYVDENGCPTDDPKKKKKSDDGDVSGASWGKDGTGDHKGVKAGTLSNPFGQAWMPDKLPKVLKKYAIDPKKVELGWENPKNWGTSGLSTKGQCVNFSTSMFGLIWTKDGKVTTQTQNMSNGIRGNGADNVSYAEKVYGIKASHKPSKGAIFSAAAGSKMGPDASAGHTGIVSHVFKNGDVLLVEQNVNPITSGKGSGDEAGRPMTWNYRLVDKEAAATQTYATLDGKKGWKVNNKLKK